jgi:hypothetical protein
MATTGERLELGVDELRRRLDPASRFANHDLGK